MRNVFRNEPVWGVNDASKRNKDTIIARKIKVQDFVLIKRLQISSTKRLRGAYLLRGYSENDRETCPEICVGKVSYL